MLTAMSFKPYRKKTGAAGSVAVSWAGLRYTRQSMSCGALSLATSAARGSLSAPIGFTVLELGNKTVQGDLKSCSMKTTSKAGRTQTAMKFLIEN